MIDIGDTLAEEERLRSRIAEAQVANLTSNMWITLVSNALIAASATYILDEESHDGLIWDWLVLAMSYGVLRYLCILVVFNSEYMRSRPRMVLNILTAMAVVSGLSWCPIPLHFVDFTASSSAPYFVFILAGIATGAFIQSLACWRVGIGFAAPVLAATLWALVASDGTFNGIIALNLLLYSVMLARSAFASEAGFVRNQATAVRATTLADSLGTANREIRKSNLALEQIANSDDLTGLANRLRFTEALRAACASRRPVALVLVDLDQFKAINDTRGHGFGDLVLKIVADMLRTECDRGELAVRLGGDEFAVLVEGGIAEERALDIAGGLLDRLAAPQRIGTHAIVLGASIGVAVGREVSGEDLLAQADIALYRAKEEGRGGIAVFDLAMSRRLTLQRHIERDLERALDDGSLDLHFQPQVEIEGGALVGFEALLRWTHPQVGPIAPPDVVKAAHRLHLSEALTRFVCVRACDFLRRLDARGHRDCTVAINVSPNDFSLFSPAAVLKEIAEAHDVAPHRLEIEITEEALLDSQQVGPDLQRIERFGFSLALDDFGTGHSSISHMIDLKIDRLKIDRSFVDGIAVNPTHRQLVGAVVAVSRALGRRVVAEGIERGEDAEVLRALGCDFGQGWHYGRAMPPTTALEWADRRGRDLGPTAALAG